MSAPEPRPHQVVRMVVGMGELEWALELTERLLPTGPLGSPHRSEGLPWEWAAPVVTPQVFIPSFWVERRASRTSWWMPGTRVGAEMVMPTRVGAGMVMRTTFLAPMGARLLRRVEPVETPSPPGVATEGMRISQVRGVETVGMTVSCPSSWPEGQGGTAEPPLAVVDPWDQV